MFILVSRRNTTAIGWEMLGLFPGTAISSLRCHPRPLHIPREIGVHAVEGSSPQHSSSSSVRPPDRRRTFQRTNWGTEQLSEDPRSCSKRMSASSPGVLIPMSDTETRRGSVHRMDPRYFPSPVRTSAAGQEEGEARNSLDGKQDFHPVGLWDCDFRWPLPVRSHRFVFKAWCLTTCLL